jgi:hypothetical protein
MRKSTHFASNEFLLSGRWTRHVWRLEAWQHWTKLLNIFRHIGRRRAKVGMTSLARNAPWPAVTYHQQLLVQIASTSIEMKFVTFLLLFCSFFLDGLRPLVSSRLEFLAMVEALCYKAEGRRLETRWGEWIISIYLNLPAPLGPGVYSASICLPETQVKIFLESRARSVCEANNLTSTCEPLV